MDRDRELLAEYDRGWVSRESVAHIFGISLSYVRELRAHLAADAEKLVGKRKLIKGLAVYRELSKKRTPNRGGRGEQEVAAGEDPEEEIDEEYWDARYRKAKAQKMEVELQKQLGQLKHVDEIHRVFAIAAGPIRKASEILQKQFGEDAYLVLADAIAEADRHVEELVGVEEVPTEEQIDRDADVIAVPVAAGD